MVHKLKRSITSPRSEREEREAAKRARIGLSMVIAQDDRMEQTPKQMQTVNDVWEEFAWSQARKTFISKNT